MFGFGNGGFGFGNNNCCTIILIILILKFLGLLDVCNPNSRNAITLLLLWWLCGSGFGSNCRGNRSNNCRCMRRAPMGCCCRRCC